MNKLYKSIRRDMRNKILIHALWRCMNHHYHRPKEVKTEDAKTEADEAEDLTRYGYQDPKPAQSRHKSLPHSRLKLPQRYGFYSNHNHSLGGFGVRAH